MLSIKPPDYKHCPFCGRGLEVKQEESKERKYCPECKWTYYPYVECSVVAVIIWDRKVLLVQRNREPYKGSWMFPSGFVDYGEHPDETLRREVKEETGLEIEKSSLIEVNQCQDDPRVMGHFRFYYRVDVKRGKLQTDGEENQGVDWFELDNLPIIRWQGHLGMMEKIKRETRAGVEPA